MSIDPQQFSDRLKYSELNESVAKYFQYLLYVGRGEASARQLVSLCRIATQDFVSAGTTWALSSLDMRMLLEIHHINLEIYREHGFEILFGPENELSFTRSDPHLKEAFSDTNKLSQFVEVMRRHGFHFLEKKEVLYEAEAFDGIPLYFGLDYNGDPLRPHADKLNLNVAEPKVVPSPPLTALATMLIGEKLAYQFTRFSGSAYNPNPCELNRSSHHMHFSINPIAKRDTDKIYNGIHGLCQLLSHGLVFGRSASDYKSGRGGSPTIIKIFDNTGIMQGKDAAVRLIDGPHFEYRYTQRHNPAKRVESGKVIGFEPMIFSTYLTLVGIRHGLNSRKSLIPISPDKIVKLYGHENSLSQKPVMVHGMSKEVFIKRLEHAARDEFLNSTMNRSILTAVIKIMIEQTKLEIEEKLPHRPQPRSFGK